MTAKDLCAVPIEKLKKWQKKERKNKEEEAAERKAIEEDEWRQQ